ncbi:MAG: DVUA0089 family protein [Planctomycetaceae bacterium]|nr:DVUA0089 family protein [Planctomycetaceae bacterium]
MPFQNILTRHLLALVRARAFHRSNRRRTTYRWCSELLEDRTLLSSIGTGDLIVAPGGPSDTNDAISEANAINYDSPSSGYSIVPGDDVDMFRFTTTTSNQQVSIDVDRGGSSTLDSYLRLFSASGSQLASNDDGAAPGETSGLDSYLEYTFSTPGTYFFGVSAFGNSSYNAVTGTGDSTASTTGSYTVTIQDIGDANDAISEATTLSNGVPRTGFAIEDATNGGEDVDMFRFSATAGQMIGIDVDRISGNLDSYLRLFNASGTQLASNDDGVGPGEENSSLESFISYSITTTGTYYVGVSALGNTGYNATTGAGDTNASTEGDFRITLVDRSDTNDQLPEATELVPGTPSSIFSISPADDVDMFRFTATAGQRFGFDVDRTTGTLDSIVRIFNSSGTQLALNDDGAGPGESFTTESYLQYTFTSGGTYYIGVSGYNNRTYNAVTGAGDSGGVSTGSYRLTMTEIPTGPAADVVRFNPATGATTFGESERFNFSFSAGPSFPSGGQVFEGDFDGDGDTDLAHLGIGGGLRVSLSNGVTLQAPTVWGAYTNAETARFIGVGDFNGDGRDDFVARGTDGRWRLQHSTGSFFNKVNGPGVAATGWFDSQTLIADFDNDGRDDTALRRTTGEWYLGYGTATSLQIQFAGSWNETAYNWFDVRTGDFNGDGRTDIISRTQLGGWFILQQNSARARFTMRFGGKWSPTYTWMDVVTGDFNNDGEDDILGWEPRGIWWGNYGSAGIMVQQSFGRWSPTADWLPVVGDFDGDGRDDIAGYQQNSGAWWNLLGTPTGLSVTMYFGNSGALSGSQLVAGTFVDP